MKYRSEKIECAYCKKTIHENEIAYKTRYSDSIHCGICSAKINGRLLCKKCGKIFEKDEAVHMIENKWFCYECNSVLLKEKEELLRIGKEHYSIVKKFLAELEVLCKKYDLEIYGDITIDGKDYNYMAEDLINEFEKE